jgi:hypothetical protein
MAKESVVHIGDLVINLDRIVMARRNTKTGDVAIYFSVQPEGIETLTGDNATVFWNFYSTLSPSLPVAQPSAKKKHK